MKQVLKYLLDTQAMADDDQRRPRAIELDCVPAKHHPALLDDTPQDCAAFAVGKIRRTLCKLMLWGSQQRANQAL